MSLFLTFSALRGHSNQDSIALYRLCSEEFAGRGYVRGGDSLAAEFIASLYREIGLLPFSKSYFQPFEFVINIFPKTVSLSSESKSFMPGTEFVVHSSSPTVVGARRPFYIREAFSSPLQFTKLVSGLNTSKDILVFDSRLFKTKEEKESLAAAIHMLSEKVPVIQLVEKQPFWHCSQKQAKFPAFDIWAESFKEPEKISFQIDSRIKKHRARNVIARIKSTGRTKRRIVFTAHYDHLGMMGSECYFPGANDNASGVVLMLAIARKLIQQPAKHTEYVFIAFAGEEVGLLGSEYFVKKPFFRLKSIRFVLNLDIFGGAHQSITAVNGSIHEEEFNTLKACNDSLQVTPEIKKRGTSANSDHHYFHMKGIKSFFLYSGGLNKHYHVPQDLPEDVDLELLEKTSILLTSFIKKLS